MSTALAKTADGGAALAHVETLDLGIPVEQLIARVDKIAEVQSRVMKLDHHYGVVPGTKGKPSLFKPGAELLCLAFQLAPDFTVEDRWDGEHLECVVKCTLVHGPTEVKVGSGVGSCSTKESKYAYRGGRRKCPECGSDAALNKSKRDNGFYCWDKKGGCGANFRGDDKRITEQQTGRVANPDLADQYNTVRKMASKRALVAAVLITCGASHLFTQDVEDMPRDGAGGSSDDDGGWDGGGAPGPGYDGYGYGDGRDGPPPRQQQRPSQNQQRAGGQQRSSGGNGADAAKSAEHTSKMLEAFAAAKSVEALDECTAELNLLKAEQALTLDDYRKLRDAYSARARELKTPARQSLKGHT
jgi:hypothetical protein